MKIGVVTMQKNEGELLQSWWTYYAKLFSPKNITILDNGSTDARTISALQDAQDAGCNIIASPDPKDFERKGEIVSQIIHQKCGEYDYMLPCDADEFLVFMEEGILSSDPQRIKDEMSAIGNCGKPIVRIGKSIWNIPGTSNGYFVDAKKVIVRPCKTISLDLGFHLYAFDTKTDTVDAGLIAESKFCLIHFHNKSFREVLRSARRKLAHRVREFSISAGREYRGNGGHLFRYFGMTEDAYYSSFPSPTHEFDSVFTSCGMSVPLSEPLSRMTLDEHRLLISAVNLSAYEKIFVGTVSELELLFELLHGKSSYLEYGAGATTRLACEVGVQKVISVETDVNFCEKFIKEQQVGKYISTNRLILKHVFLGPTKEWGYPVIAPTQGQLDAYYAPIRSATDAELVFIDGRYRVACAAASYVGSHIDALIAIHDYFSRKSYHVVEKFLELVDRRDDLAIFRKIPNKKRIAQEIFSKHEHVAS